MEGRRIGRRYVLEVPDRGSPGAAVWRARDEATGAAALVTVLDEAPGADAVLAALAGARHPGLPVVLDHGVDDGVRYLATPMRAGRSARSALAGRPLPGPELARLGADLAGALAALHGAGLVQGGLTLDAVVWDEAGSPRLEDLATAGLARPPLRPEDDLRALGLLLREAAGAGPDEDLLGRAGLPPRLAALIGALGGGAPPSAASAAEALSRIADGVEAPTAPPSPVTTEPAEAAIPPSRRRGLRVLVGLLAALVLVLAAVAVARVVDRRDAERRAQEAALPGPITTVAAPEETELLVLPTTEAVETVATTAAEAPVEPAPAGPVPIGIAAVTAVDPGGDRAENGDLARRAVDRSPRSAWPTEEYKDAGFGGKDGVGLVLRLDAPARVTSLVVRARPTGAVVRVYALRGDPPETAPRGWEEASAEVELARPRTRIRVDRRRPATALLLWITRLPGPNGANAVEIADVRVLGEPRGA